MEIIDAFIYKICNFLVEKFNKDKSDAKFSAYLYLILYSTFFFLGLTGLIGLIEDNSVSQFFLHSGHLAVFITGIVFAILYGFRYYKFISMDSIEEKYLNSTYNRQRILRFAVYLLIFGVPVFSFVFFRLYILKSR